MSLLLDALKKAAQEKQIADSADIKAEAYAGPGLEDDNDLELQQNDDGYEQAQLPEELDLVLDDDAHTRKLAIDRFLVLRQGMIASCFVGRAHAMVRQFVVQSLVACITSYPNLLGNPLRGA